VQTTQDTVFVDGEWARSDNAELLTVVDPATEEKVAEVPLATTADVDRAVAAARAAFDRGPWPETTAVERGQILKRAGALLREAGDGPAETLTAEMGSPIAQSKGAQIPIACDLLEYYGDLADEVPGPERRPSFDAMNEGLDVEVVYAPVGVVAAIVPWNGPHILAAMKVAPALLAGCTVILKPAPEAFLNLVSFADALRDAGLPAGVLNVVPADREVGEYLVRHPGVDKVSFTGSTAAGRRVGGICGELIRPVSLELGGKSAAILLDDVDMAAAAEGLAAPMMFISGQACNAPTRILAPRTRYEEAVEAIVASVDGAPFGDSHDPDTFVGPLAAKRQQERVEGYIQAGIDEGATAALGGPGQPEGFDHGWYVNKTVFSWVDNSMRIAQEEIFGPVYCVIPYDGDDEAALEVANDSTYGLAGSVWTSDVERGREVAKKIRAGGLGVNSHTLDCAAPIGGFKDSGFGRERGVEAIAGFLASKSIIAPKEG